MEIIKYLSEKTGSALSFPYKRLPNDLEELALFEIKDIKESTIYIIEAAPNNLNNLKYHGVEVLLKSYFNAINLGIKKFAFILCGFEDELSFYMYCDYAQVLKLPNVSYLSIDGDLNSRVESLFNNEIAIVDRNEAIDRIKEIPIKRPTSFRTNHSITNEWSIYRWSHLLGIENDIPKALKEEIKNSLYYRYVITINKLKNVDKLSIVDFNFPTKSNIFLIDDEEEKGWSAFLKTLLGNKVDFKSIGEKFKSLITQDEVIDYVRNQISDGRADIIILDLRLHDHDYADHLPVSELTGMKILKIIKEEINRGIQVIIFSATNKAVSLQYAMEQGADGFIMKESPENSGTEKFTYDSVKQLSAVIRKGSIRIFLKEIWTKISALNKIIAVNPIPILQDFYKKTKLELEKSFIIMNLADTANPNDKNLSFGFLQLFQIIEDFATQIIETDEIAGYSYINDIIIRKAVSGNSKNNIYKFEIPLKYVTEKKYHILSSSVETIETRTKNMDLNFKISSILIFMYGFQDSNQLKWQSINLARHGFVHSGRLINQDKIMEALDLLIHLLDNRKVNYDINRFNGIEY